MKRKYLAQKFLAFALTASMAAGMCPSTAFAVTGDKVAADGTYKSDETELVQKKNDKWTNYGVSVSLDVKDGKIVKVKADKSSSFNSESEGYFNDAFDEFYNNAVGKDATEDAVKAIPADTESGATRTYTALQKAAIAAINKAEEKSNVDISALDTVIKSVESLVEADYTTESWNNLQTALESAKSARTSNKQSTVDSAVTSLNQAIENLEKKSVYVVMNVPYNDFYKAYNLTDKAVWTVEDGVDAVSTATTNKFKGVTGLAKGTYNNGKYIMGVTIPVEIKGSDFEKLNSKLTAQDNYYFTTVTDKPEAYSKLTVNKDGTYSFSKMEQSTVSTSELSVGSLKLNGGYGDYQVTIKGLGTDGKLKISDTESKEYTLYGAVLNTKSGKSYGMTTLENIWLGTKTDNVEIAWSIKEGQGLKRAHGSGDNFYQFNDMNGATLSSVTLITSLGVINVPCGKDGLKLDEYYAGDLSNLSYSLNNDSNELEISGIPNDLKDVTVSVSDGLATKETIKNGKINLDKKPTAGKLYTISIESSNFSKITRTTSTPVVQSQKAELEKWVNKAKAIENPVNKADLDEHVKEAEAIINGTDTNSLSADAQELIGELIEKVKKNYPTANATATIKDNTLDIVLDDLKLSDLENPTYTLSYRQGRGFTTLTSGSLKELSTDLENITDGTEYTITIVSDNYQDITTKATAENYKYVYAGLTWNEYWASEGVYAAGSDASSDITDARDESDKGAFDTVSRATTNHGLHRGSFQCNATIEAEDGSTYAISHWSEDGKTIYLTDGTSVSYAKGVITKADGSTTKLKDYKVVGLKYVPVKVREKDYDAFKEKYTVFENGATLSGGYGENNLNAYSVTADATANTNGIKTVTKNEDGSFSFSERAIGTDSGIKDAKLKVATGLEPEVKAANGSFGEFLRVDFNGNYGDLGANMQAVKWTYYGDDSTYSTPIATYGTKFAADNWMHKSMGIQLGLTDSLRCQLPNGTDGTGYWKITIYALGYEDYSYQFQATDANIVKPVEDEVNTDALSDKIKEAEALKEADYTADSWSAMLSELQEAKDELNKDKKTQATVDEALAHLTAAINDLVKVENKGDNPVTVDTTKLAAAISQAEALKEADYTADSWKALTTNLANAKAALSADDQTKVDNATASLNKAIESLVKKAAQGTQGSGSAASGSQSGQQISTGNGSSATAPAATTKAKDTKTLNAKKTGDQNPIVGMMSAFVAAICLIGAGLFRRRKVNK